MDALEPLWVSIQDTFSVVTTYAFWLQMGVIIVAGVCAWLLHNRWYRYSHDISNADDHRIRTLTLRSVRRIIFPISMLIMVILARTVLQHLSYPYKLLDLAIPLLMSLAVVRLTVFILRRSFSPGPALKAWENLIGTSIWLLVALHLLNWLPGILESLDEFAFVLGDTRISVLAIIKLVISIAVMLVLALWLSSAIERRIRGSQHLSPGVRVAVAKISRFVLLIMALLISLDAVGIDLTALTVFGGAVGVGLGFGLQRIASNFISGFILIFDRSIRPGDVISIGDTFGWVQELRARYVVVRDRDGVERLIPNENLITTEVINWSYSDPNVRLKIPLQISYADNPELAIRLMEDAARASPRVLTDPPPASRLREFGDNGITLELRVWITDPQNGIANVTTDVYLAIWHAFKEHNITIPFPQRDLHIKNMPENAVKTSDTV